MRQCAPKVRSHRPKQCIEAQPRFNNKFNRRPRSNIDRLLTAWTRAAAWCGQQLSRAFRQPAYRLLVAAKDRGLLGRDIRSVRGAGEVRGVQ